ncbi:hypothetical protein [Glaciimonas soli]|uniref:Secreted protein n=1 Tax=Glaciimonas soli TaxID=2590999 RepID=A0A843YKA1_9BURK|nr:hypothetical protein [Glaciimonas soli]MQQ99814.1 hypothetical protein [Glaciimonas soli]
MYKNTRITCLFILGLTCQFSLADETNTPTADTARIRLFGQNGFGVKLYENSSCVGGKSETVSGGIGDAFASFVGAASNKSIGMPATPNSEHPSARNGFLSKAFFREYAITPQQPVTITSSFSSNPGTNNSLECRKLATTFTPEAGKDYEVSLELTPTRCEQVINEIHATTDGVMLEPVPAVKAESCH